MAITIEDLGWMEVSGKVEPRALAGSIAADASERIAETLVYTIRACEEDGRELDDHQKQTLIEGLLRCWDGFEGSTLDELLRQLPLETGDGS